MLCFPGESCRALKVRSTAPLTAIAPQTVGYRGSVSGGCRGSAAVNSSGESGETSVAASETEKQLLVKLLQWPSAQLFPVLDLARLLAMDAEFANWLAATSGSIASLQGKQLEAPLLHLQEVVTVALMSYSSLLQMALVEHWPRLWHNHAPPLISRQG